ncbi:MAG: alpha-amylase [Paramuribaculum sp.]|nr:alpha-amylase [Paramuribaculum sp.]
MEKIKKKKKLNNQNQNNMDQKPIIYQLIPRLFTNYTVECVHGGSILQNGSGKLNDINCEILKSIKELGVTHVWYTGVLEHAHCSDYTRYGIPKDNPHVVKGLAGSPYAIKDYYDIDPDIAENVPDRIKEFENLVARTHDAGMKVIIDFVPNHVARQYHSDAAPAEVEDFGSKDDNGLGFSPNNNFYYITRQLFAPSVDMGAGKDAYVEFPAKATGNDCFTAFPGQCDWYDTVKLNYGVDYANWSHHFSPIPDTWYKMLDILLYWVSKGVDGFRCDMAHMVPIEFWHWAIGAVKQHNPHVIFIAELYDTGIYRNFIHTGGFDYLYDKVNLYDTLRGIQTANYSAAQLTGCWQTVEGIGDNMLNFLENHDEQRFGSQFYAGAAEKVIPSLVVSSMIGSGAMMIYMGQELGESATDAEGYSGHDGRTTIYDYWSIESLRNWLNNGSPSEDNLTDRQKWLRGKYVRILNLCNSEKAFANGRFFDLMYVNYENPTLNPHRQYVFMRSLGDETIIIAVNFSDDAGDLKINLPQHAFEVLQIPQGKAKMTELLTNSKAVKHIADSHPFEVSVEPWGAAIWKVKHKNISPVKEKNGDV